MAGKEVNCSWRGARRPARSVRGRPRVAVGFPAALRAENEYIYKRARDMVII